MSSAIENPSHVMMGTRPVSWWGIVVLIFFLVSEPSAHHPQSPCLAGPAFSCKFLKLLQCCGFTSCCVFFLLVILPDSYFRNYVCGLWSFVKPWLSVPFFFLFYTLDCLNCKYIFFMGLFQLTILFVQNVIL